MADFNRFIQSFHFKDKSLRCVYKDGARWFALDDLAHILQIKDVRTICNEIPRTWLDIYCHKSLRGANKEFVIVRYPALFICARHVADHAQLVQVADWLHDCIGIEKREAFLNNEVVPVLQQVKRLMHKNNEYGRTLTALTEDGCKHALMVSVKLDALNENTSRCIEELEAIQQLRLVVSDREEV